MFRNVTQPYQSHLMISAWKCYTTLHKGPVTIRKSGQITSIGRLGVGVGPQAPGRYYFIWRTGDRIKVDFENTEFRRIVFPLRYKLNPLSLFFQSNISLYPELDEYQLEWLMGSIDSSGKNQMAFQRPF